MRVGMCTIQVVSRCFGDKVMKEKTERGVGWRNCLLSALLFAFFFFFFFFLFGCTDTLYQLNRVVLAIERSTNG